MQLFRKNTSGYTLIEILVVVVIMAFLFIVSLSLYTTHTQKAHDAVRQSDMMLLKSAIDLALTEYQQYPRPSQFEGIISEFVTEIPQDPRTEKPNGKNSQHRYVYASSYGQNTFVEGEEYELSILFEYSENKDQEETDNGNDEYRYEIGEGIKHVNTNLPETGNTCTDSNNYEFGVGASGDCVIIGE
jgi:prepilin-type N-terminal cleavage/methylation domain-containing protein